MTTTNTGPTCSRCRHPIERIDDTWICRGCRHYYDQDYERWRAWTTMDCFGCGARNAVIKYPFFLNDHQCDPKLEARIENGRKAHEKVGRLHTPTFDDRLHYSQRLTAGDG